MVIKCKEDLVNTCVDGRDKLVCETFQKLAFSFEVKWYGFDDQEVRHWSGDRHYMFCISRGDGEEDITLSWEVSGSSLLDNCKQLHLSDLIDLENSKVYTTDKEVSEVSNLDGMISELDTKPLTRVEYVKVESPKLSELVVMWENEELYTLSMDNYKIVQNIDRVIRLHRDGGAYQRVEKEIDWREEVTEYLENVDSGAGMCDISFNYQEKSLSDESFVKMCHLVTSLTKGE